ncbi:MAG: hypothetical protein LBV55_00655 [Acholeplasmatales bacterium]|jgi:hypothetical protein|nr:hypothetical protein [Acholeplasmatales bacterium]
MQKTIMKKILLVLLVFLSTILLFSCNKIDHPTGSISDDLYFTSGQYSVTEKELWEEFRNGADSTLNTLFEESLVSEQIVEIKNIIAHPVAEKLEGEVGYDEYQAWARVIEWVETQVTTALWGSSDWATIKALVNNATTLSVRVDKFLDSLVNNNRSFLTEVNDGTLKSSLIDLLNAWYAKGEPKSTDPYRIWGYPSSILDLYALKAAQKLFAWASLDEDIARDEEGNTTFVKESDLVNYYKNSLKSRYEVGAFIVPFYSQTEANNALYKFNLKSNSRGEWFQIPDPRNPSIFNFPTNDDIPTSLIHVRTILNELNITLSTDATIKRISEADYKRYYDRYSISENRTDGNPDSALSTQDVLAKFIEIYNDVNGTTIDEVEANVIYQYEDALFKANTSLRDHIYNTLLIPTTEKPNNKQYSPRVQTFGNYVYLVYKFSDSSNLEENIIVKEKDKDDNEVEVFISQAKDETKDKYVDKYSTTEWDELLARSTEFRDKAAKKVKLNKFNDAYTNEKINKLKEDKKTYVYDEVIYKFYNKNYAAAKAEYKKPKNNDIIGKYGDVEITIDALFARMEKEKGIYTAMDIVSIKYLRERYYEKITKDDIDQYTLQFKNALNGFTQGQQETNGFPASIGMDNFLLLAFGSSNMDKAFDNAFIVPKLKELFYKDYEYHYGEGIYEKLASLSSDAYYSYWQTTVSHLLVYVDYNLDGTPDDPKDYYKYKFGDNPTALEINNVRSDVGALVEKIYQLLADYSNIDTAINAIISEFNGVGRISQVKYSTNDLLEGNEGLVDKWAQFRQDGLFLKYESLGEINNSTNFPAAAKYDQVFYDRVNEVRANLDTYRAEDGKIPGDKAIFPRLDFYQGWGTTVITPESLVDVESGFGWHFILVSNISYPTSAKYLVSSDSKTEPKYVSEHLDVFGNKLNAYNNLETISANQIEIFIKETDSQYGIESIPSSVSSAITTYLQPIITKYQSSTFQSELTFKLVFDFHGGSYANSELNDYIAFLRGSNRRSIEEYNRNDDPNNEWTKVWGKFWTTLEGASLTVTNVQIELGTPSIDWNQYIKAWDANGTELKASSPYIVIDESGINWSTAVKGIYGVKVSLLLGGATYQRTIYVTVNPSDPTIIDSTAPTIDISYFPAGKTDYTIGANYESWLYQILSHVSASDANDGDLSQAIIINDQWLNLTVEGSYILIFTVIDASGNSKTASLSVEVHI